MIWKPYEVKNQIEITAFYSFFEERLPRLWNFEGESHDFWECVYVSGGDIFASGDGRIYHLKSGEMIFHKPMEFHKLWVDNEAGAEIMVFSFSAKGSFFDMFRDKVFRLSVEEQDIVTNMLKFVRTSNKDINDLSYLTLSTEKEGYLQQIVSFLQLLFYSLAENNNTAKAEKTTEAQIFHRAVEFMKKNISNQLSLEEIAKNLQTSLSSLKRIFERYTGIPVHKYFVNMKIKAATELLRDGFSVTYTAEALGFCSQAHFSKVYKSVTGKNPSKLK